VAAQDNTEQKDENLLKSVARRRRAWIIFTECHLRTMQTFTYTQCL